MSQENYPPRFVYWRLNSRAQLPMLMLRASNLHYEWDSYTANTWPNPKDKMPFGQLPVLFHNDRVIAQSSTISRYCAKLAGLLPTDEDAALQVDMLMEHCKDIFSIFSKAKYSASNISDPDAAKSTQKRAWADVREVQLPQKLDYLAKHLGVNKFFSGPPPTFNAADVAVFSTLYLVRQAGLWTCLDKYPTLISHYERMKTQGSIQEFIDEKNNPYFVAPPPEEFSDGAPAVAVMF